MKFGNGFITGRNQLQWVVLLLAAAVVLPTVALLWFMSRVVANERLVAREKLAALYQDRLIDAAAETEALCAERVKALDGIRPTANPYSILTRLVLENDFFRTLIAFLAKAARNCDRRNLLRLAPILKDIHAQS